MAWITPKIDWVPEDFINFVDWNRIENNTVELRNILTSFGFLIPVSSAKFNRDATSVDYLVDINRIEKAIQDLRDSFTWFEGYGGRKNWIARQVFNHEDAIRLENNLLLLRDNSIRMEQMFRRCGATNCGDGGIVFQ